MYLLLVSYWLFLESFCKIYFRVTTLYILKLCHYMYLAISCLFVHLCVFLSLWCMRNYVCTIYHHGLHGLVPRLPYHPRTCVCSSPKINQDMYKRWQLHCLVFVVVKEEEEW